MKKTNDYIIVKTLDTEKIYEVTGYKMSSYFFNIFTFAEPLGKDVILNVYSSIKQQTKDYKKKNELCVSLLAKYDAYSDDSAERELFELYENLALDYVHYCEKTFKGTEPEYFFDIVGRFIEI